MYDQANTTFDQKFTKHFTSVDVVFTVKKVAANNYYIIFEILDKDGVYVGGGSDNLVKDPASYIFYSSVSYSQITHCYILSR